MKRKINFRKFKKNHKKTTAVTSSSIGARLFRYFAVFAVTIMLILWLLQILFIQTFYQGMKRHELQKIAATIESGYGSENLFDTINYLTARSDVYVQITCGDTVLFETISGNPADRMNHFASTYDSQILKERLFSKQIRRTILTFASPQGNESGDAMIYASILEGGTDNPQQYATNTYLFIYSPLTAVSSTIDILAKMLILVTVISILFGLIMSIIISRRLARPLHNITASAAKLADGSYAANFDGSGYAETEELAAMLNYAAEELSKSDKLQKDLVANVSHDLKTPLTMVKSYAEMIRDLSGDNPEKRNRHLQVIINEADRLNGLVNDLTMLSKMQANVDTASLAPLDLSYIARETIESFSLHSEQDGFTFHLETEGNTEVPADEKKIRQVFSNLIGNSVRYSGENKNITVRIKELPETVRCEVADHGQGIAKEDLESIWDRYYQSSSNHSRTSKGSGLGLSIVKQIFILHHAKYGVESTEQQGSTFWFELKKTTEEHQ